MNAKKVYQFLNETNDPLMAVLSSLRSLGYTAEESEFILHSYINDPDSQPNIGLNPMEIAKLMADKVMKNLAKE